MLLCICILAGALVGGSTATASGASRVFVMDGAGRVHARIDRALPARIEDLMPHMATVATAATPRAPFARAARKRERTLRGELKRLLRTHQIDDATYRRDSASFTRALRTVKRLHGTRRSELQAVVNILHGIAARGQLTPSRLPQLFLILERNRQWWTTGRLLGYGQRVEFSDSELVWEEYPGQGLQLQALGTFGKANGLWMSHQDTQLRTLLDEMVPLAAQRGDARVWEYDFAFGGGVPPWTSGLSQATGIQALARASQELDDPAYLAAAKAALPLFEEAPPVGVRLRTALGARYLIYSYAPGQIVINAFVQALVGLHDYAEIANDDTARKLFDDGDRQAQRDVPAGNTGAWSLYQLGGAESTLSYHELLQGFLANLCQRTQTDVYCTTADDYKQDLKTPPELTLLTKRIKAGHTVIVRFRLSKISRVGMTIRHGPRTVLATSATVSRGVHGYAWRVPHVPGHYDVTLTGTDLAGNGGRATGTIVVKGRAPHT
jgi:hypothetical protein